MLVMGGQRKWRGMEKRRRKGNRKEERASEAVGENVEGQRNEKRRKKTVGVMEEQGKWKGMGEKRRKEDSRREKRTSDAIGKNTERERNEKRIIDSRSER